MSVTVGRTARRGLVGTTAGALLLGTLGVVAGASATAASPDGDRATYLGKSLYTGEFHSHTSVSDGVKMPVDAFDHVHSETEADFFTVSEHDVMWDLRNGDDFVDDWRDADSQEWRQVHEDAFAFNDAQDDLVAVPSIENTWYDGTGHINVFNADWKATARATEKGSVDGFGNAFGTGDMKYDMYTFFARIKQDPDAIGQFNHPSAHGKGHFFGFNGLDPAVDESMELIEVKSPAQLDEYIGALDTGWHIGPVWNGDEHSATWVSGNQAISGVWAREHSLEGLYGAMRDRSTYSSQDGNLELAFGGNEELMGSILPADTTTVSFDVRLEDPDERDAFTKVELVTNGGAVAHDFPGIAGRTLTLEHEQAVAEGDWYFVRATQADGHVVVSAPIWVGETTRGANYAPEISVADGFASTAAYGATIELPQVTATDDSGLDPTVTFEVYDAAGVVDVTDGAFRVRGYDDHFVVVKAEDGQGNIGSELLRIVVDQDTLDPDGVFQYFGSTAVVTEQPGGAGIAVSTDRSIDKVYAQVLPAGRDDWSSAEVLTSTNDRAYEVNTIGNDEPGYQHSITGQTLRSHEFDLTELTDGERYQYRFGVAVGGAAPAPAAAAAWTEVRGAFVAGGAGNEPIYAIGDLQATSHDAGDLGMLRDVLATLQEKTPGGRTLLQTGDLVDNGGRGQYWEEAFEHVFDGLDVQYAPVAGNHETYGDLDYNAHSEERTAIFGNMFDTPKNGAIGESNYSFNRGDVHIAVLNSVHDMDKQLDWLAKDIRASDRKWNVVTGHYSYYGGSHGDDGPLAADRPKLTAAFEKLGVDLYIGGHDHIYKRSTIYDGRLAATPAEEALGTTFVTLGSAGPKFYDNVVHWWDDVVFDENAQLGTVLEVTDAGLELTTYTVDGREVDTYTVTKPTDHWRITSTDVVDRRLEGVGVISTEGAPSSTTLVAATYDSTGRELRDLRTVDVALDHQGSEQFATFGTPLPVNPSDTVEVYAWDSLAGARPMTAPIVAREGIEGEGTAADPYLITSGADLAKVANDPGGHYRLTTDLDLTGETHSQIDRLVSFTGVLDGAGHTITGFTTPGTEGVGLFADNDGTVRNLSVVGDVETERGTVGLVADVNHGLIEQVRTSGSITGSTRVGGVVGDHYGTIRDAYSTADVTTTGLYAGGVVAIATGGSISERLLSTGAVRAQGRNAGGLVSYGYENTVVSQSVSLNDIVQASSFSHAVVGRVADGQIADLSRNYMSSGVTVTGESLTDPPAADNWKGEVVRAADLRTAAWFTNLGWDLDGVWEWHAKAKRPLLRNAPEEIDDSAVAPSLAQDEDGFYLIAEPAHLAQVTEFPEESYRLAADLDLGGIDVPQLATRRPFNGVLDGAGHEIRGWTSPAGGLFAVIGADGAVRDLGIVDVRIDKPTARAGALVDTLRGTVERVWTSGEVIAKEYAAGVAGDSFGTIRDAYSTATVRTSGGNYAGGIVGVADSPSLTERVYATGVVTATGTSGGGISGYARNSATVVRKAFALNPSVTGTTTTQRVVARAANGQTPTLADLYAAEFVVAGVQSAPDTGPTTFNGATVSAADAARESTWADGLGLDFEQTWAWDDNGDRPVLRTATEEVPEAPGPTAEQDEDGAWLIATPTDLRALATHPDERFRLAADIDLAGTVVRVPTFRGSLDGAGHEIRGLRSSEGGLFGVIDTAGVVTDLVLVQVEISKAGNKAGGLVDTLRGTVERVGVSGAVSAPSYAGGIAGDSFGTIRDAWSTADVTTTTAAYAGGIVGVADAPSTTERVYATGAVRSGAASAGGLTGYARNAGTVVRHGVVLSPVVTATTNAHRAIARFAGAEPATLGDLWAVDTLVPAVQVSTEVGPTTRNGGSLTAAELAQESTWSGIGFDLEQVWQWDADLARPVLRVPAPPAAGSVGRNRPAPGFATRAATTAPEADAPGHTLVAGADGLVTLALDLGPVAAGGEVGVVVLRSAADPNAPGVSDVAYLGQRTLDADGRVTLDLVLPDEPAAYRLVAGSSAGDVRYVAPLDPDVPVDPTTSATVSAGDLEVGVGSTATLTVRVAGADGAPTGTVRVLAGATVVGAAQLADGAAHVVLPARSLPVGTHQLRVAYDGDGTYAVASTTVRVRVTKAQAEVRVLKVKPKRIEVRRTRPVLRVRVDVPAGVTADGTVTVRIPGAKNVRAVVRNGVVKLRLPTFQRAGTRRLKVVFAGNAEVEKARAVVTIKVRR
ncbi:metallophosphoesterase [Nocardioides carbamazepini]|uniref:metallophosphoesterase n=1 Tax=Nocardioides carbamazepini TaxID=2854259 RepID=UPI002149EC8C|nr:Ig-like domain repeat protein [Nocardioides carbamazepini]MCR1784135.1 metallophosphoesterase [Nocardioides carbamazepini]